MKQGPLHWGSKGASSGLSELPEREEVREQTALCWALSKDQALQVVGECCPNADRSVTSASTNHKK